MDGQEHDRPYWREEDNEPAVREFQGRHRSFSDKVERFLMQLVILGLVALVLVQTLQVIPFIRKHMSVTEALEGISANEILSWSGWGNQEETARQQPAQQVAQQVAQQAGGQQVGQKQAGQQQIAGPVASAAGVTQPFTLTVMVVSQRSAPAAKLLVDGKAVGTFGGGTVTVKVRAGQVVAVDGTGSRQALTFRVVGTVGLTSPEVGSSVTTHGDQKRLGSVQSAR